MFHLNYCHISSFFSLRACGLISFLLLSSNLIAQEKLSDDAETYKPELVKMCGMELISRSASPEENHLHHYHYIDSEWSRPASVHESDSTFSKRPSIVKTNVGQVIAVWVERSAGDSQIVYKVRQVDKSWQRRAIKITSTGGHKTAPIIFNSMSGQVYLAWVSDQNDNDDIFFSSWSGSSWSSPESLSDTNKNPDISPTFNYEKNSQGRYDLVLGWQQRNEDGIYQDASFLIEYDLELDPELHELSQHCSKILEKVALPSDVKSGFIYRNYGLLDNHQRIRPRFR